MGKLWPSHAPRPVHGPPNPNQPLLRTRCSDTRAMLKLPSFCILLLGVPLAFAITPADTFTGYVAEQGYNVTQHSVVTADGYILGLFRLPRPGAPVVLLQHGIFVSSWCWIDNHKEYAPAFQLYDRGYDVWMSNSR